MTELEFHPISNMFPLMTGADFDFLVGDIAEHGQIEPILIYEGKILDGRNRYRACLQLGLVPIIQEWQGDGSPTMFVLSENLHRRHLTSSQWACSAMEALPMLEQEARKRMLAGKKPDPVTILSQGQEGKSRDQAAKLFHSSAGYISAAKRLAQDAPGLFKEVFEGRMALVEAMRQLRRRERTNVPPLPSDKFRVIYADPPWQYTGPNLDQYGPAERHYPTMTIQELCDKGPEIRELAESDSVLFMWATSPLLEQAFKVITAWGFDYKASFIWDKVRHNYGHYNSVRHELLLIAVRGSCLPDTNELLDSVVTLERTDEHSEKPEEFRAIIDHLYLHGGKIELYSRREAPPGWNVWGNEPSHNGR